MLWREEWREREVIVFGHSQKSPKGRIAGPAKYGYVMVEVENLEPFEWDPYQLMDIKTAWRLAQWRKGRGHRKGGKTRSDTWCVASECGSDRHFFGSRTVDKKYQHVTISSHCLACAKTEILSKYGGKVDIRGWHKQGHCGIFLKATAIAMENEDEDNI